MGLLHAQLQTLYRAKDAVSVLLARAQDRPQTRLSQVKIHDHGAVAGRGERLGQVHRYGGLALFRKAAGDHDDLVLAQVLVKQELCPQNVVGLPDLMKSEIFRSGKEP